MTSKLILSLDGGGIRGAASARFLKRVEEKLEADHNKSLRDCVDFYAGTSTGSIIALALATTDLSTSKIDELYKKQTSVAAKKGIFGSPSFIVDNEVFWGDDRLEDAIGWLRNPLKVGL